MYFMLKIVIIIFGGGGNISRLHRYSPSEAFPPHLKTSLTAYKGGHVTRFTCAYNNYMSASATNTPLT